MKKIDVDILFLYRTPKKRHYFTQLCNHALTNFTTEVHGYRQLPRLPNTTDKSKLENKTLKALLAQAEIQHFSARSGLMPTLIKRASRPFFKFYLRNLYRKIDGTLSSTSPKLIAIWNGDKMQDHVLHAVNQNFGIPIVYFENGVLPDTTTIDMKGINANNSVPRLASAFNDHSNTPPDSAAPIQIRKARKAPKSNEDSQAMPPSYILVPFQLDRDSQILSNSLWLKSMPELFNACCRARDEAGLTDIPLVFREHPSSRAKYPELHKLASEKENVHFNSTEDLASSLLNADAVITINSTVGLHAMLSGKNVIVLGNAFYTIDGLVLQANSDSTLAKAISDSLEFKIDLELRNRFWHYLIDEYAITGDWNHPRDEHYEHVRNKFVQFKDQCAARSTHS